MTTKRYWVQTWGEGAVCGDFQARIDEDLPVLDVVAERIAKRMRLSVCGGPRRDIDAAQVTLGRHLGKGQGYTDIREVWVSVTEVES